MHLFCLRVPQNGRPLALVRSLYVCVSVCVSLIYAGFLKILTPTLCVTVKVRKIKFPCWQSFKNKSRNFHCILSHFHYIKHLLQRFPFYVFVSLFQSLAHLCVLRYVQMLFFFIFWSRKRMTKKQQRRLLLQNKSASLDMFDAGDTFERLQVLCVCTTK